MFAWTDLFDRCWPSLLAAALMACALFPLSLGNRLDAQATGVQGTAAEWPRQWNGLPLQPLAMSPLERRFAEQFPGRIGRFRSGIYSLVLREVRRPTRMLHPAVDCYRGLGYRIEQIRLERDADALLWRCFAAGRDGRRVRVCERIVDARGQVFTDTSAWFWAASLAQSSGPWLAITRVEAR